MSVIRSNVETHSEPFRANQTAMTALMDDLGARVHRVKEGGGERARKRHLDRGKLLPRERIRTLIDMGAAFSGALAARRRRHV